MRLSALLDPDVTVEGAGWQEVEIRGLSADTRTLAPGMLFAALAGAKADGRAFIEDALARGAAAVLSDATQAGAGLAVPLVLDVSPRRRLALMAARFYGRQPRSVAAVTGTNGKTSVASFTRQLWAAQGLRAASLGTLGIEAPGRRRGGSLTTPDPVALHALLAELAAEGTDHLVLEASSHGLDQHRLDGVTLSAAAFTNLSRDHFDYHGSAEAYFAAKRRLFAELLPKGGIAVLNADQPEYDELAELCRGRGIEVLDFGRRARRVRLLEQRPQGGGQRLRIAVDGRVHGFESALAGDFQASNLLAALGLVVATGGDPLRTLGALDRVRGAPGRLQRVGTHASGAEVFVDYAHTPDALAKVLDALRPHVKGRLLVVFGCGGDRDPGKRPVMGQIAAERADLVVVTDDNPRSEEPARIRAAVMAGCPGAREIGDRAEAIAGAIAGLRAGDVLVVAGKGHETGQIVGDRVLPFDDAEEVRRALALSGGEPATEVAP
jgi:UDP-N-acetylmuramoyl-L-alanyl-D-glutamate--2,6-diaminopimelate ligase